MLSGKPYMGDQLINLYTEDEAKLKWCPKLQAVYVYNNRTASGDKCLGSGRMWWIWEGYEKQYVSCGILNMRR